MKNLLEGKETCLLCNVADGSLLVFPFAGLACFMESNM